MDNWIYKNNNDNTARFVLGQPGENNLIHWASKQLQTVTHD